MIPETGLKCVITGSFERYKPEIDLTIEEFRDLGVEILAPDTGWVLKPKYQILTPTPRTFRPLLSERGMDILQIENQFLASLAVSDFQFLENPGGYLGVSGSFELGFALAKGKAVFARYPLSRLLDPDQLWQETVISIDVLPPSEVVNALLERR